MSVWKTLKCLYLWRKTNSVGVIFSYKGRANYQEISEKAFRILMYIKNYSS